MWALQPPEHPSLGKFLLEMPEVVPWEQSVTPVKTRKCLLLQHSPCVCTYKYEIRKNTSQKTPADLPLAAPSIWFFPPLF